MRTRLLPVLTLALASTVGCSQAPPTAPSTQPQAPDAQRQIAQADDDADQVQADESQMPEPMSVQALPQKLDPSQVVELPADKIKEIAPSSSDRSVQQWRGRGFSRSFGRFGGLGFSNLRYFYSSPYYYPYYNYGNYYYPYAYYPYTYAYYPYSYYNYSYPYAYNYYPYYSSYGSYFPYSFRFSSFSRRFRGTGRRGFSGRSFGGGRGGRR